MFLYVCRHNYDLVEYHPRFALSKMRYMLSYWVGPSTLMGYPTLGGLSRIRDDLIWVSGWVKNGPIIVYHMWMAPFKIN